MDSDSGPGAGLRVLPGLRPSQRPGITAALVQAQVDLAIAVRNVPLAVAWLVVGYYCSGQVLLRRRHWQDSDSEAQADALIAAIPLILVAW